MSDSTGGFPRYPGGDMGPDKPGVIPLRPLSLGEILDGALATMRRYAGLVFGVSALVALLTALLHLGADVWLLDSRAPVRPVDPNAPPQRQIDQSLTVLQDALRDTGVLAVITLLMQTFLTGFLMVVVGKAVLGHRITFSEAWEDLRPRLLPLLGLTVLVTAAVLLGLVALVIPGIFLYVLLSLATPALILERSGIGQSMGRSRLLVLGSWWRVFGVLIVAQLVTFVIGYLIQLPFGTATDTPAPGVGYPLGDLLVIELGAAVAQAITVPFAAAVTALLYIDQRMRREGLGGELARAARMT